MALGGRVQPGLADRRRRTPHPAVAGHRLDHSGRSGRRPAEQHPPAYRVRLDEPYGDPLPERQHAFAARSNGWVVEGDHATRALTAFVHIEHSGFELVVQTIGEQYRLREVDRAAFG